MIPPLLVPPVAFVVSILVTAIFYSCLPTQRKP
jgi:hypothetical protein